MTATYTVDQVQSLLNLVVEGLRVGVEDRVYTLEEVAARTGWALSTLEDDCRRGRVQHTKRGRSLGMTSRQIAAEAQRHVAGRDGAPLADEDGLTQVRAKTLQSGARRPSRKTR